MGRLFVIFVSELTYGERDREIVDMLWLFLMFVSEMICGKREGQRDCLDAMFIYLFLIFGSEMVMKRERERD